MKKEYSKTITVNISETQTIMELSELTQIYQAEIYLKKIVRGSVIEISLKSFLGLITLHLQNGDSIVVRTIGEDSREALEKVESFLTKENE
ncbi:HPr family phosphocarrier protein [Bacillus taeanensis]|uniref:HPr family phosphocarrier protein n=1 Tax=Bacillus taeanensis TaxID=273032 RepID=A0A366XT22_9BACI|nr:HPr family phosphocarrier protein [Bacillus taeanensis]RBW69292.1 HPr family phosphocarrier protein [Bacillus taeanensis]